MEKTLIVEMNEFNFGLMKEIGNEHNLSHLKKLSTLNHTLTKTDDTYDSGFLEPWVQWVNVHTGVPSKNHGIKHLGDVPNLTNKQIWEHLSDLNITTGVWGVMNGSRNGAQLCKFFIPDPWTFSEHGYPSKLNQLLDLPRYMSKNYSNVNIKTFIKKSINFIGGLNMLRVGVMKFLVELYHLMLGVCQFGFKNFLFISFFDAISTEIFFYYRKSYKTQVNFLFLNSIAHVQHHYWSKQDRPKLVYAYKTFNRIMGKIFQNNDKDEVLIVMNALTQINTNEDKEWILYRQKDPLQFFTMLNLNIEKIEQLMTYDTQLFFPSLVMATKAEKQLKSIMINDKPLFLCEKDLLNENKIFCRIDFNENIENDAAFIYDGKTYRFEDYFYPIVIRTGKHSMQGDILTNLQSMPTQLYNHDFYQFLVSQFDKQQGIIL